MRSQSVRGFAAPVVYKARSPAALAIAAGLVAADSRILIHFKKNIDRPQLTARIMKRRDVVELRDMVRLYESRMDPGHVVATLTRLQQLLRWRRDYRTSDSTASTAIPSDGGVSESEELQQRLATGVETTRLLVPVIQAVSAGKREEGVKFRYQFKPDSAAALLWALAKLPPDIRAPVPGELMDTVLSRAVRSAGALHDSPPKRMSLLLWSISKLTAPTGSESSGGSYLSPQASSAAVDAVLAMTLAPTRLKPYLEMCSPAILAMIVLSLERLGRLSKPIAEAIASEVLMRMPNLAFKPFEPADYVGVAQGFARASISAPEAVQGVAVPLLATMAAHLTSGKILSWKPEHLSQLAAAFAAAGVRHDGLFLGPLASAARPRLGEFHAWALDDLRGAYKALGYKEAWL